MRCTLRDMDNCRAHPHSRVNITSPHPASTSSSCSSSYPSPSPAPTPPLHSSSSPSQQSDHHHGCRDHSSPTALLKLQAAQRKHALKLRRNLPPLSPQESCTLSFSDSASSSPAQVLIPVTDQSSFPLYHTPAVREQHLTKNLKHASFSSFLVNGSESPARISSAFAGAPWRLQASPLLFRGDYPNGLADVVSTPSTLQPSQRRKINHKSDQEEGCAPAEKRLKFSLEDLEKELLGDDPDMSESSFMISDQPHMADASSLLSDRPATGSLGVDITCEPLAFQHPASDERDWTDAIEDFLSTESSSPTMTTDHSTITSITCTSGASNTIPHRPMQSPTPSSHPKELLLACADAIDNGDYATAGVKLSALQQYVSTYGDPLQRVAAHMAEGLAARRLELIKGGHCGRLLQVVRSEASPTEILRSEQVLYQSCLYFKFGYLAANAAIAEACRNERKIHIIDFDVGHGNQWQTFIGALAQRQHLGGPPHIRITVVADPSRPPTNLVGVAAKRLEEVARIAKVPLQLHQLQMEASQVEPWMLHIKPGEAVAVNFAFHLHKMADESVSTSNPRDSLLRKVKALQPKIVTLVEHDANTNTAPFYPRFVESLDYFNAVFESIDVVLPRNSKERANAEKHCLARDMMNIVACEGVDRLQRYEKAGKWRARMMMAGFRSVPASVYTNRLIKELLVPYSSKYRVREEAGGLQLQWLDRCLVATSAWQ